MSEQLERSLAQRGEGDLECAAPFRRDLGRQLKATLLLADAAQAADGKLYVLGGGWSVTGPQPTPMAIALKIDVPWDQANSRHRWRIELVDADGQPVEVEEAAARRLEQEFELGRPPGVKPGTSLDFVSRSTSRRCRWSPVASTRGS